MPTSIVQVGLVNKTADIDPDLIQTVAQALSIQDVMPLRTASKIPPGVWPATGGSLRTWIDNRMREVLDEKAIDRHNCQSTNKDLLDHCRARRKTLDEISRKRADLYVTQRHAASGA